MGFKRPVSVFQRYGSRNSARQQKSGMALRGEDAAVAAVTVVDVQRDAALRAGRDRP